MIDIDSPIPTPEVVTVEDIEEMVAAVKAARRYHQDVLELVHKELPDEMLFENAAVIGYLIDVAEWHEANGTAYMYELALKANTRRDKIEEEGIFTHPCHVEEALAEELPEYAMYIKPFLRR